MPTAKQVDVWSTGHCAGSLFAAWSVLRPSSSHTLPRRLSSSFSRLGRRQLAYEELPRYSPSGGDERLGGASKEDGRPAPTTPFCGSLPLQ